MPGVARGRVLKGSRAAVARDTAMAPNSAKIPIAEGRDGMWVKAQSIVPLDSLAAAPQYNINPAHCRSPMYMSKIIQARRKTGVFRPRRTPGVSPALLDARVLKNDALRRPLLLRTDNGNKACCSPARCI